MKISVLVLVYNNLKLKHPLNKICLLITLLLHISNAVCQNKKSKYSTSIVSFAEKAVIQANINTQADSYSLQSENNSNYTISTNNQFRLDLSLNYDFIGLTIGFSPKFIPGNNDNDLKGESSYQDFRFRFFLGNWVQELQYRKVEGFYIENSKDLIPNWVEGNDPYVQFPNLKTIFWGGSTSYILNPNFSLKNLVANTEWQRKSAGSFIPTLNYSYTHLSGTIGKSKIYENNFNISIAPEYYYTLVIHQNWFVSLSTSPSFGIRFSKDGEEGTNVNESNIYWPISFDGGLQIGYSSSSFFYGANLKFETTWYNEDSKTNILNDRVFAKIYLGYRFDAPKKVKKTINMIKEKLGQ